MKRTRLKWSRVTGGEIYISLWGFAVSLKVKFNSLVTGFIFYERAQSKCELHKPWFRKCIMIWTNEISKDFRERKKKELLLLIRLAKFRKQSFLWTSPVHSEAKLCTNGRNSRTLFSSLRTEHPIKTNSVITNVIIWQVAKNLGNFLTTIGLSHIGRY